MEKDKETQHPDKKTTVSDMETDAISNEPGNSTISHQAMSDNDVVQASNIDKDDPNIGPSKNAPVEKEDGKRQVPVNIPISASSPTGTVISGIPASPPRFVSLEQFMKAASGISDMLLTHEIAVNEDFALEKKETTGKSLQDQVKKIVHQAFWDLLEEELKEDPCNYTQAMVLLHDVKEGLMSLLLPQHNRLRTEIEEVLDVNLIKQQAEKGVLDVQKYAHFVLSVMARLCAPIRDQRIQEIMTMTEVSSLFKAILETIDLMKLDMANFTIKQFRPHIQQCSIDYERKKFQEFMEKQKELCVDGLEFTRQWLRRSFTKLQHESPAEFGDKAGASKVPVSSEHNVLITAYIELLEWDDNNVFPESLVMDKSRFLTIRGQVTMATLVASVLLVTYSVIGSPVQDVNDFKEHLKENVMILMEECSQCSESELFSKLEGVAIYVIQECQKFLIKHDFKPLTGDQEDSLKIQIRNISSANHRVRIIVRDRIFQFVKDVISSSTANPVQVPIGLSILKTELTSIAGQFLKIVTYNRAVFGDYYSEIIKEFAV
ncbi:T-complex protein 11-like protein 1 [Limulus polyphemus]|uniref:T-complex protein 11-like protein 1 n=1 Tax=Limulus polyphemus TaxID=6850 RepID=A0ABM1B1L2_LIMPO|nr:T-complex protein 11-like protein 1 [Limulus polyphemus]XP_022239877.1 T-complex protein 11-like protein 1 [Limulus polyphemus]